MFIRAPFPIWQFIDPITGLPLNDEYWVSFLSNVFPYVPQLVFQDNQGLVPWSDPIRLSSAGQLPNNLYFNDSEVYRIEVRKGPTQTDPLINLVQDFIPGGESPPTPGTGEGSEENQISNPQFAFVNFLPIALNGPPTLTLTTAGTYNIAPSWFLLLVGTGSATIEQLIISGNENTVTTPQPAYALQITTSGWSSAILYQRLAGNGGIWSNTFVSMSVFARSDNSIANPISLIYKPSDAGTPTVIAQGNLSTSIYQSIQGVVPLPQSTDTDLNNVAYVDMQIVLPPTGVVDISNVQVMGQSELIPVDFATSPEETIERQTDHLFNYYLPLIEKIPISTYLVGWDFPLNPAQSQGSSCGPYATGANTSNYTWDQTILFQSTNSGLMVTRSNGGYSISASATSQAAIIQYLDGTQAQKLLQNLLSVNLSAFSSTASQLGIQVTVSLWYTTDGSLPSMGSASSLVATLDSKGKPATFNGTWTEVTPINSQDATVFVGPQTGTATNFSNYPFNGWWDLNNLVAAATATAFAIVVGTASITTADSLIINSVSLNPGGIAAPPLLLSADETLRQCQYYYEKSYDPGVVPGTNISAGVVEIHSAAFDSGTSTFAFPSVIYLKFSQIKRIAPIVQFYTEPGVASQLTVILISGNSQLASANFPISDYAVASLGTQTIILHPTITSTSVTVGSSVPSAQTITLFHYVADSRLGVV
jgi:hypothetical protein